MTFSSAFVRLRMPTTLQRIHSPCHLKIQLLSKKRSPPAISPSVPAKSETKRLATGYLEGDRIKHTCGSAEYEHGKAFSTHLPGSVLPPSGACHADPRQRRYPPARCARFADWTVKGDKP